MLTLHRMHWCIADDWAGIDMLGGKAGVRNGHVRKDDGDECDSECAETFGVA